VEEAKADNIKVKGSNSTPWLHFDKGWTVGIFQICQNYPIYDKVNNRNFPIVSEESNLWQGEIFRYCTNFPIWSEFFDEEDELFRQSCWKPVLSYTQFGSVTSVLDDRIFHQLSLQCCHHHMCITCSQVHHLLEHGSYSKIFGGFYTSLYGNGH